MKQVLVPGWKGAYKWLSVQAALLAVVWGGLPPDVQASILAMLWDMPAERVPAILGVLMLVSRLINQSPPANRDDEAA
jgi:hypothetical protein